MVGTGTERVKTEGRAQSLPYFCMIDFEYLRKNGLLLFEYIRGSHLYGLNTENSDEDHGGIYIEPLESIMGLGIGFPEVVCDKNNDETWYSFKKYMSLLLNSNPNILESLYVPKDKILYMHPVWEEVLKERDKFITKKCFGSFMGYAKTQLEKAYKLKSRIVNPVFEKLSPLDFVYYPYQQGARKIKFWLEEKGLMQEHCGLTKVPHMDCTYNVYYDWGAHWLEKGVKSWEDFERLLEDPLEPDVKEFLNLTDAYIVYSKGELSLTEINKEKVKGLYEKYKTPFKYHGIISRNGDSEEIRYSSVPFREERPMIQISYNKDEFSRHRQQYREWNLWDKEHNQERFNRASKALYDCYVDSETLFLTNNGWKKFDEVNLILDKIACFNNKHELIFSEIKSKTDKNYSGKIYTFESRYTKFSITESHNLYISHRPRSPKDNYSSIYIPEKANWELISVKEFMSKREGYYNYISGTINSNSDNLQYSDDFIKLLGMYLSEGCWQKNANGSRVSVRLSQLEGNRGCEVVRSITSIPIKEFKYNKRKNRTEVTWEVRDPSVLSRLKECGGYYSLDKTIPKFVYSFSKRQFDLLLSAMVAGDGHIHKKGHIVYYTSSRTMAIELYTLLSLNGYKSQLYGYDNSYVYEEKRKGLDQNVNPKYQVFISSNQNDIYLSMNRSKTNLEKGKYFGWTIKDVVDERVVCFETTEGTIITMNNGKIALQGNCKNATHSARLLAMGIEIARGEGVKIDRSKIDRDFLMTIRRGEKTYEEIMEYLQGRDQEMKEAMAKSTLPDEIDVDFLQNLMIKVRKEFYGL